MDIIEYQHKQNEQRHPWEMARLEVVYRLLRKHFDKQKAIVLDVGCGDTFVVQELKKRFPDAGFYAIDKAFTPGLIREFQTEGIKLAAGINDLESEVQKADVVLLMDVIEHIEDDKAFLRDLLARPFITTETLFLITVPAYQRLFSAHDVFLQHYRRYSRKALNKTLNESGFHIVESGSFFSSLLLPRLAQIAKERIAGRKEVKGLAAWQGSQKQAALLKEILLLDFKFTGALQRAGIKFPGLSTYALCRKSVS
jgi:trans-aconitate methyltransferase